MTYQERADMREMQDDYCKLENKLAEAEGQRDRLREAIETYLGALEYEGHARLEGLRAALQEASDEDKD